MRALSRKTANRKSLLRNLATSLVLYEKITTTTAKAKEVRPIVEHLISIAKKNDLSARRKLLSFFFDENAVKKTLEVLVPRYKDKNSGFIRMYKTKPRLGDNAEMTLLKLEQAPEIKEVEKEVNSPTDGKEVKKAKEVKNVK